MIGLIIIGLVVLVTILGVIDMTRQINNLPDEE